MELSIMAVKIALYSSFSLLSILSYVTILLLYYMMPKQLCSMVYFNNLKFVNCRISFYLPCATNKYQEWQQLCNCMLCHWTIDGRLTNDMAKSGRPPTSRPSYKAQQHTTSALHCKSH